MERRVVVGDLFEFVKAVDDVVFRDVEFDVLVNVCAFVEHLGCAVENVTQRRNEFLGIGEQANASRLAKTIAFRF